MRLQLTPKKCHGGWVSLSVSGRDEEEVIGK